MKPPNPNSTGSTPAWAATTTGTRAVPGRSTASPRGDSLRGFREFSFCLKFIRLPENIFLITLKRLVFVNVDKGWSWVKGLESELENEKWNGRENCSGRKCFWFGVGVNLGYRKDLFKGKSISNGLRIRGNELWGGEDWNSILAYKYDKGVELKDHVDRKWLSRKVVIVNFCRDIVNFRYGSEIYKLRDGEVIEIDSSVLHGVREVSSERWSLSFRKI